MLLLGCLTKIFHLYKENLDQETGFVHHFKVMGMAVLLGTVNATEVFLIVSTNLCLDPESEPLRPNVSDSDPENSSNTAANGAQRSAVFLALMTWFSF